MPNPFLPLWEYIPDGEPRVFGDRVYIYGSHDRVACDVFCDFKLKVWSASVNDLNNWQCHGDSFRTRPGKTSPDIPANTPWTDHELFAPDVVEKDGKYYLYAYIVDAKGAVGVSDRPEGPFKLLSQYQYNTKVGDEGTFNDAGVLVDDDGKVYVYYGFTESNMNEINPANMYEIVDDSYIRPIIADTEDVPREQRFFEASSPRKIGDTYYLIYSPIEGNRLAYATSDSPKGPFTYRGYIVDNGDQYPAGNDHGSICQINGQWYIFYHRMTNNTIMSRRACVEKIEILPDGTIPTVEMTSLGFEESLNPYQITPADIACVLIGNGYVTEKDLFTRVITNIKNGTIIGYKYFDFGDDYTGDKMQVALKVHGMGVKCKVHIYLDGYKEENEIGQIEIGTGDGTYKGYIQNVTGRHALYFKADHCVSNWTAPYFDDKPLFELAEFVILK